MFLYNGDRMKLRSLVNSIKSWVENKILYLSLAVIDKVIGSKNTTEEALKDIKLDEEDTVLDQASAEIELIPLLYSGLIEESTKLKLTNSYRALIISTSSKDLLTVCIKVIDTSNNSPLWLPFLVIDSPDSPELTLH